MKWCIIFLRKSEGIDELGKSKAILFTAVCNYCFYV